MAPSQLCMHPCVNTVQRRPGPSTMNPVLCQAKRNEKPPHFFRGIKKAVRHRLFKSCCDIRSDAVLYAVAFLRAFAVVEPVERANEIAGYAAYPLEALVPVILSASAMRALVADDAGISAHGIPVDRVIY